MITPFALSASVTDFAVQLVALPFIIGCITGFFALLFRLHTGEALPEGPTLILGLGILSLILNTRVALIQFVGSGEYSLTRGQVLLNLLLLGIAGIAATAGRYGGDRIATSTRISSWIRSLALPSLQWFGRAVTIRLPDQIDDIDGYDPIAEETREVLEGLELEFPRGLTTDELREAIAGRLKDEHAVGYVDIEVSSDASVEYLALGRRAATLGATLPPRYRAVAVHGDPPFSASPGDTIQIWQSDSDSTDGAKRVGKGELRATVDTMATVVVDESTVDEIDAEQEYRFIR